MHFVISGNPFDGMQLFGPFVDEEEACEWAEKETTDSWWLITADNTGGRKPFVVACAIDGSDYVYAIGVDDGEWNVNCEDEAAELLSQIQRKMS